MKTELSQEMFTNLGQKLASNWFPKADARPNPMKVQLNCDVVALPRSLNMHLQSTTAQIIEPSYIPVFTLGFFCAEQSTFFSGFWKNEH